MSYATHIECKICHSRFDLCEINFCPSCGKPGLIDANNWTLEVEYDLRKIKAEVSKKDLLCENTLWRYLPLLPIGKPDLILSLGEGMTPLVKCKNIEKEFGIKNVYIKDETRNPTGSFKDRMIAIIFQKARELNNHVLLIVSDGNLGSSGAAYCSKHGKTECIIMTYPHITEAKLYQMLIYGGKVFDVKGSLEERVGLFLKLAERKGWYVVNYDHIGNPYALEGYKTIGYEISEQLGWQAPDHVIVPTGSGEGISGVYKGFKELYELGWIQTMPRIHAAQVEGNDPLVRAVNAKLDNVVPLSVMEPTVVGGINTDITGYTALEAVIATGGTGVTVSEKEALEGEKLMATREAVYTEPASGVAFYGIRKLKEQGVISPDASVVCVATSHGLKDLRAAKAIVREPFEIPADIKAFDNKLKEWNEQLI